MNMKKALVSVMITGVLFFLSACGSGSGSLFRDDISDFISGSYQLYDTVSSAENSDDFARIYLAEDQDISSVASELQKHEEPTEMSEPRNGKQILVYDNQFVTLTESEDDSSDTIIELAGEEFVRNNYSPSFFEGYLLATFLNNIFGNSWSNDRSQACRSNPDRCYGGYGSAGTFVGKNAVPSLRGGSSSVRGGGIGEGK
ncbi:DUF4247 domain-containing protein [Jeotgalibacillus soli]|uniref:DUF4247 domain-containing protein n=1 Tax=Jeotgalibacillus soli TaxID=889306 RepID=A0A0C2VK05_9BACL|nr:DUF4247 domain-containing protein [Jeotgalibacillus soli]KIL44328.1 hypothetical protein KP78_32920 [Jeotgalibacillus soli]